MVKMIQKHLRKAEEAIALINKEETFYKWDRTSYPEVEVIKEEIDTYHKLFGLILKWQDAESRSDIHPSNVFFFFFLLPVITLYPVYE